MKSERPGVAYENLQVMPNKLSRNQGANNAGKSSVAESLALLFSRERMYQPLSDWDFFGGDPKSESRFRITATISDFGDDPVADTASFPEWFARISCSKHHLHNIRSKTVNDD